MKLRFEAAPPEARRAMEDALEGVALRNAADGVPTLSLNLKDEERVELKYYTLNPDEAASQPPLRTLTPSGWAFVVQTSETKALNSKYSLAHVVESEGGFRFTHLQHGWITVAMFKTLAAARAGTWRKTGTFSPAILHISGLRIIALWFRGASEKQDQLVPLLHRTVEGQSPIADRARGTHHFLSMVEQRWKDQPHFNNAPRNLGTMPPLFNLHLPL